MPINFNVQNAHTGASTVALNESRLDRILNASTLNEAQRMGVFDRLKDWCRGGVKADAIRQIYDQISAPQAHDAQPVSMLHRFERLRSMVTDEHRGSFSVTHNEPAGPGANQWSYALRIGETQVYHSGPLDDMPGQRSSEFKTSLNIYDGLNKSIDYFKSNCLRAPETITDPKHFIDSRIECMSDDPEVQQRITNELQNPLFSRANFRGFEQVEANKSFHAIFQQEGGEPVKLLLSDREPSRGEFRQQPLRDALQGDSYRNLEELLSRGHLTDQDSNVIMLIGSASGDLTGAIDNELNVIESSTRQRFEFLRDLQPLNNPWFEMLHAQKFGEVSMMDAFFPDSKADASDLVRFDQARVQLQEVSAEQVSGWARAAGAGMPNRDVNAYVLENTQDLVDDEAERKVLVERLDDPLYSAANFKRIEAGEPGKTFKAVFEQDGQEHVLELSDRRASTNEFRSDRVKDLLRGGGYAKLRDVLSTGHLGAGDAIVGGAANATILIQFANTLGLLLQDVPRFLQHLQQYGPADLADRTFDLLRNAHIARTNALELLMGDRAPPAPPAVIAPQQYA